MQERHLTPELYFNEQSYTTKNHVIPFIGEAMPVTGDLRVLEIGCGHGGNIAPFLDLGCTVTGLDINPGDIETAERFLASHANRSRATLLTTDIYDAEPNVLGMFDLIIMKDVIEHIHDQDRFIRFIRQFLSDEGRIFFGFPPWHMPFGGHQQVCKNRFLASLPYVHLLPASLYKGVLESFGESRLRVDELIETKETGISIERFQKIVQNGGYEIELERLFLINPNYQIKFKIQPREQYRPISALPGLRNFATTCCYYLVRQA